MIQVFKFMSKLKIFNTIPLTIPYQAIYNRLGYNKHKTIILDKAKDKIDSKIFEAAQSCILNGCYDIFDIQKNSGETILLSGGHIFESKNICERYKDCVQLAVLFTTSGSEVMQLIEKTIKNERGSDASIFDAAASEITDTAINWLHNYLKNTLLRAAKFVHPFRFSPGYGDFSITHQQKIFNILKLSTFNIQLTESYMLIPEKSVSAICGIK